MRLTPGGLAGGQLHAERVREPQLSAEDFLERQKRRRGWRSDAKTSRFFEHAYAR